MTETLQSTDAPLAYNTADAARALGISRAHLFREIAAGRLTAKKIGRRRIVIPFDSATAWLTNLPDSTSNAA